jgi:hypothetical protein
MLSIRNLPDAMIGTETQLLIGRFGQLELNGGLVLVGNNDTRTDDILLNNDGLIRGGGRIDTGLFRNRYLGEVRVGLDQTLLLNSTSEFEGTMDLEPLNNWGLIEVLGGELEVVRTSTPSTTGTQEIVAPFVNARLAAPPAIGRDAGLIVAQSAVLRFGTGIINQGTIAFTAGIDNIVTGDVTNDIESMLGLNNGGKIIVTGDETFVTFENNLTNAGTIDIAPDATGITVLGDFDTSMGTLSLTLGGGESGQEFSHIAVGGLATLGGALEVSLNSSGANPLAPMEGAAYEIISAVEGLIGDFTSFTLPFLGIDLGWFTDPDPVAGTYTLRVLSTALAIGADFNGDGLVDNDDYLIWLANLGNPGGLGDANGDGRVDGRDFLIWQMQLGGPGMPVPGAGSAAGSGVAAVPEPSTLILCALACCMLLRRRWLLHAAQAPMVGQAPPENVPGQQSSQTLHSTELASRRDFSR